MRCAGLALVWIGLVGAALIETPMSLLSNPTSPLVPQPQRVTGYFELNTTHAGSMFYWYGVTAGRRNVSRHDAHLFRCLTRLHKAVEHAYTSMLDVSQVF